MQSFELELGCEAMKNGIGAYSQLCFAGLCNRTACGQFFMFV